MEKKTGIPAALYMILSALSFALMGAAVKQAAQIPFLQKVFFRNFIMIIVILPVLLAKGRSAGRRIFTGAPEHRLRMLTRSLFGLSGVALYFYSINGLTLADSSLLNKLSAFFVMILSALFLGERIRFYQIPALAAAFGGRSAYSQTGVQYEFHPGRGGASRRLLCGIGIYDYCLSQGEGRSNDDNLLVFGRVDD